MSFAAGDLAKALITKFTLKWFFSSVDPFMPYLVGSGVESFATECARESAFVFMIGHMSFEL